MTKPAWESASVGKRSRTPTTRAITGRPSTVSAIRPSGPADAAVCGSASTGTGRVSVGCAGRSTPGVPLAEKPTIAALPLVAGPVVADPVVAGPVVADPVVADPVVAAPTPRQAPSGTDRDGPRAGRTVSGPSATRAEACVAAPGFS